MTPIDAHPILGPAVAAIQKEEMEKLQGCDKDDVSCNDSTVMMSNLDDSPKSVLHFDEFHEEELQAYKDIFWHCHLAYMKPATFTLYANMLRMYAMVPAKQKGAKLEALLEEIRFHHPDDDEDDEETIRDMLHMVARLVSAMKDAQVYEYAETLDAVVLADTEEDSEEDDVLTPCDLTPHFLKVSVNAHDSKAGYDPSSDESSTDIDKKEGTGVFSLVDGMCGGVQDNTKEAPTLSEPEEHTFDYELKRVDNHIPKPNPAKEVEPVMEGIELELHEKTLTSPTIVADPKATLIPGPKAPKINLEFILKNSIFDETMSDLSLTEEPLGVEKDFHASASKDSKYFCHGCTMQ